MPGPFVHQIDPVITDVAGIYLWWYGLSYSLGFLGVYFWFRRARERMEMSLSDVYGISLYLAVGVLLGGRFVEVVFYEWDYYSNHLWHIPAYWIGGMSTHGLLLGGTVGTLLFCWRRGRNFLAIADELVIPAAWIMGVGRLGNFIDGQISGAVTDVWWAVQFPDIEGFRHPVVLYDGLKNLLLIPFLLWIRRAFPYRGVAFAHFVFWYAFLRLFVDLFREYRVESLGLGTGQIINITMSVLGLTLIIWFHWRKRPRVHTVSHATGPTDSGGAMTLWVQRVLFGLLVLFCLAMPSDWTQDVPARYGARHPGLSYSILYPRIEARLPIRESGAEQRCLVEGYTTRWVMSYCMFLHETDDEANPGVSKCFLAEFASIDDRGDDENCDANRMYKTAICGLQIEYAIFDGTLLECLRSDETVPSVVLEGVG